MEQNQQPYEYGVPSEKSQYPAKKWELLFAIGILCACLLLANVTVFGGFNLGYAIAAALCILLSSAYLLRSGCKMTPYSAALLILSLVIAASFARSDDGFVKFVMLCFLLVSVNLGLCLLAGKNRRSPGTAATLADAGFTLFSLGIGEIPKASRGLADAFRRSGPMGRNSGAVLLGLCIALPVLLIIVPLLMQADAAFEGLMDQLPEFSFHEFFITAILGVSAACVLYSRGVALKHCEEKPLVKKQRKGLAPLTVNTVLGVVCFIYCVYLASQLAYFVGGFAGILPEEYTLAQYARRGFFEMAWLCAINLSIIIFSLSVCAKQESTPLSTRLLCLFIGIVTLFLVVAASAKMLLYIGSYGLTRLRVLTQVVMVFLAIVTALVSVWLFVPKLPYMKTVIVTALVIGAAVSWADVDTQVARYNVDAYLSGKMETVDVAHLGSLGDGAVPQLARLAEEAPDPEIAEKAMDILEYRYAQTAEDFRGWNYVNYRAREYLPDLSEQVDTVYQDLHYSLGIEFPEPENETSADTHGGFHGDGVFFGTAVFRQEDGEKIVSQMAASEMWTELPLSDNLSKLVYGYHSDGYSYQSPLTLENEIPANIDSGYYYFYDRHSDSTDPYDDSKIFDRASYNLTMVIYDSDTHTIYGWELDT